MADPAIIRRLRIVMNQLTSFATRASDDKLSRYAWVLQAVFEETVDELVERGTDEVTLQEWFVYFGKIVEWCGSGDEKILPPHVRRFLAENHPQELLAIEGPKESAEAESANA